MKNIIIIGAPRTGTTVLADLLSHSPKILVTNELATFDYNPNNYLSRREKWLVENKLNRDIISRKNLTPEDIDKFKDGDFENKGDIEFFGDKFPTYCADYLYCEYLTNQYPDAYYIFTYRDPRATLYSGVYRTRLESDKKHADWYYNDLNDAIQKLERFTTNWGVHIYPYVKNKFIVDYNFYINNANQLIKDISNFLGTSLELDIKNKKSLSQENDVSFVENRELYTNTKLNAFVEGFTPDEINHIIVETRPMDRYVKFLIGQQYLNKIKIHI